MQILVVNGSPKGEYSVTLQTVRYLERLHPEHTFDVLHAGMKIRALEKDFQDAAARAARADLILFSYPVYTFIAPSQLHRFIELMKASGVALGGKAVAQITTSKHFYDVTAHRYVRENAEDMGLRYAGGLSADMDDLLSPRGREEAAAFFERVLWCMKEDAFEPPYPETPAHTPVPATADGLGAPKESAPGETADVVIVADLPEGESNLAAMIARFRAALPLATRVVNLREYPFAGGCLGCFHCATDGTCVYKDGFDAFLRGQIQTARAIVYAFTVRDHSMGARMKLYDDRQFCNGHRTVTMGMPMGYLVSGPYAHEPNLQMIVEGRAQVGGNPLCGVATDERDTNAQIDRLAKSLAWALAHAYAQPQNFYGVGGMKIFRDLIYQMRGMMKADHRFYKAHGQYDFPQKNRGAILKMYLVGALLSSPKLRAKMGNAMNEGMIAPYKKALEQAGKEG